MSDLDPFGRDYLRLTLEIDRHIDGYVDAYYGPADLRAAVSAAPPRSPSDLLADVAGLRERIPQDDPARAIYLAATLRAIGCTVRILAGETVDYLEEVYQIYDIRPQLVDEATFVAAHRALDGLLPESSGADLGERLALWRKRFEIDAAKALDLLELARAETRRRTAAFIALPEEEAVEIRLTSNQPWNAYNWYLGHGRSLIEFNTDIRLQAPALLGTFAHEGYPGHHTEGILKENELYRRRGYAEQAVALLHSPAAVISEGIATTALDMIFPDGSDQEWNVAVLFPAARLPVETGLAERLRRIGEASEALRYVSANAAILYHTGRLDQPDTIDYIRTYGLATPERAAKSFNFCTHPLYRSYPFTYTVGHDLIAAMPDAPATFRRLLTEQALPSQLA